MPNDGYCKAKYNKTRNAFPLGMSKNGTAEIK